MCYEKKCNKFKVCINCLLEKVKKKKKTWTLNSEQLSGAPESVMKAALWLRYETRQFGEICFIHTVCFVSSKTTNHVGYIILTNYWLCMH